MTGKKMVKNLKHYLDSLSSIDIPVVLFDRHNTKELPCIVVGYSSEEGSFSGTFGHYTVSGYTNICYQGYEDLGNDSADVMAETVANALQSRVGLETALNKPSSGTDTRPCSGFGINRLFVRGIQRTDEEHSTTIEIQWDAFTALKDF